jgi:Outer membrane protein beta-barrel domain
VNLRKLSVALFCVAVASATPARAQSGVGVRGYGTYGSTAVSASESLKAVAGTSTLTDFGGGAAVTGLWRGVFIDVGLSQAKVDGERVFVDETTVFKLEIPLHIKVRPIDVAAGWRVTKGRVSPFVGAGMTSLSYEETANFADADDDLMERKSGPLFLAGVDARILKWVHVGGELRYRAVKGILGAAGVSEVLPLM